MRRRYRRPKGTYYVNAVDRGEHQAVKANDAFSAALRAAFAAGAERATSASSSAVKEAPWRPQRIHAVAPRSYCGSSAWTASEG